MRSFIDIENKKIHYSDEGIGRCLVFLHGYLESLEIWNEFVKSLSKRFRIICLDLPGHGKSEELGEIHSMEQLAETVLILLDELEIKDCFLIGHSMGGYVALMFHKLFSEKLFGFSLFHSHPFADTDEIVNKRFREIEFVKKGKKELIAAINIPNAFATDNLYKYRASIEKTIQIAVQTKAKGIIANLYCMINRPDQTNILANSKKPFLYVLGKKDNYINFRTIIEKIIPPPKSEVYILNNSGHMGFIEEKDELEKVLINFISKNC